MCIWRWLSISEESSASRWLSAEQPSQAQQLCSHLLITPPCHSSPTRLPKRLKLTRSAARPQVDAHGAAGGNVASQQRRPDEEQCHPAESQGIGSSHSKEQRLHGACQCQRAGNPNRHTEKWCAIPGSESSSNIAEAAPSANTHANFAGAAADGISHHSKHAGRRKKPAQRFRRIGENDIESPRAQRSRIYL